MTNTTKKRKRHVATAKEAAWINFSAVPEFAKGTASRARAIANLHKAADNLKITGTFAFATRKDCETAAASVGAIPGSLTAGTRYLVIGAYATESWSQSAFGRKIEKAVELRAKGRPINIVGETHWVEQMTAARQGSA